jgi:methylenetetrahydrofolate dehydrogenase (NADP+)/methenyltetrahydrofolate cyclohydrolase
MCAQSVLKLPPCVKVAGAITPVPGGVGPLTNVMLLKQCVQAAWQLAGENKDFQTAA